MTHRDITRKEFLSAVTAFLGLFLLSRLPFGGGKEPFGSQAPGSYGNHPYGGTTKH
jgi:hypothetical protein